MKNQHAECFFLWAVALLLFLVGCHPDQDALKQNSFTATAEIKPPVVIEAGPPEIHSLAGLPPPLILDLSTKPAPEVYPAGFFVTMQHFNTEHGLALSSILSGFKDKAGNLWFGTFGNGVSKYDGTSFTNYNSSHGLVHNLVEAIMEDSNGNIWFSTYGGASRYNGVFFENFTTEQGLPDNHINQILEDKKGNIWLATRGGLCRYNPDKQDAGINKFIHYDEAQGFAGNYAGRLIEDRKGNLWITAAHGLIKYDPDADANGEIPFSEHSIQTGLNNTIFHCIAEDGDGLLWLGTSHGVFRFDPAKGERDPSNVFRYTVADGLVSNEITTIVEDRAGNIWLGSEEGVSEFSKKDSTFLNYTTRQGLASNTIVCIVEDNAGSLWFGTKGNGLSRFDGRSTIAYTAEQGLPGQTVFSVTEDNHGDIWIGAQNGGITKFTRDHQHKNKGSFINFSTTQGLKEGSVMNMITDKAGNLWFGAGYGLSKFGRKVITTYNSTHGLVTKSVISLQEDSKGNIWTGTYEGGLSRFDGKSFTNYTTGEGLVHNTVWNIHEDKRGVLWFATRGGLSRFDGEKFINFTTDQGLPDNKLSIVAEDKSGNLLIGSWGGGVSIIRKKMVEQLAQTGVSQITENIFENFNTANGLANDVVYGILEDDDGNIVIGTSKGLTILKGGLDQHAGKIAAQGVETFNQQTGYPIKDVSNNYSMLIDKSGLIWAGTGDKLVCFDYKKVNRNTEAPVVVIKGVKINNENISWHTLARAGKNENLQASGRKIVTPFVVDELVVFGRNLLQNERDSMVTKFQGIRFDSIRPFHAIPENLELPFAHNNIGFDFAGIETAKPFLVQYQFMLEGDDDRWSPVSFKNTAEYSNLRQGTYTFKARAKSPDGVWSEPVAYGFKVLPPWWFTPWALALYVLVFFLVILGIRRYELNRINLRNQLKLEKVETETLRNMDQLKSQFFANISHEFRTPLTLILGQVESVMTSGIDIKEKGKLQVANRNARRLLTLINELLDLSKLEAGSMELMADRNNIVSFLKSLFYSFESLAVSKKIELVFDTDHDQVFVVFDPGKMEKIFYNLMSNAFKFTPENGKIKVSIHVESKNKVTITITDTGIGIPEDKLGKIFDRFYQVDGSSTRDFEGTGIGLALTRELVELHKGTIAVTSKEGAGTGVHLSFPLAIEGTEDKVTGQGSPETGGFDMAGYSPETIELFNDPATPSPNGKEDRERVLVVEDNADVRHYIREQLEDNYRVSEARNGEEGIRMAQDDLPDLIISDVMMPRMDGYQFCKAIRTDEKTSHIPIIMLTARAGLDDKIEGLETGVDAYLTKPFNAKELRVSVKNLILQRRQLRKRFSTSTVIRPSEVSSISADREFMEKIVNTIETHFEDVQFSVEKLAEHANMSISQLNRKLNALIDQPPGQLIRSLRLQRAADLLEQDAGTVSEICYRVGFNDNAYFSRAFKKQFGCSPTDFKSENKEPNLRSG